MKKYMYTFRMTCDEVPEMPLDDGAVRIFLNTHGENDNEVSPELVELLHYMEKTSRYNKKIENERVRKLADQIENLKNNQEVGVKYMSLYEEIEEAKIETVIEMLESLMENTGWSMDKAMDVLNIPTDKRILYLRYLDILKNEE